MKLKIKSIDITAIDKMLNKNAEAARKAIKATTSDLRNRVPGKVADAVRTIYNIKKSEITPGRGSGIRKAASFRAYGDSISTLQFVYTGRPLSVARFSMTPKAPEPPKIDDKGNRKYKPIKVTIRKGKRKKLAKNAFLASTGAKDEKGVHYIPFVRKTKKRYPIKAVKTTSLPQMVANEDTSGEIKKQINEIAQKRLAHNIERFIKRG